MKTVCTLLVPGVDIPGTMYRAITATTSLALRVIFMKTIKEPAGIHAYTLNDVALLTDIFPKLLESWVYPIKIGKKTSILFCERVG